MRRRRDRSIAMSTSADTATVLVVDDELHMRLLLERCLKRAGFSVRTADRGEAAVELVARGEIDLVVLDYEMSGMNGVETLRALRALPAGKSIAAVMLTARGQADYQAEAAALGVTVFFGKPFSPAELARTALQLVNAAKV